MERTPEEYVQISQIVRIEVSILVVVERTPEDNQFFCLFFANFVSILVVVERTPEVSKLSEIISGLTCFNPCCSGKDS